MLTVYAFAFINTTYISMFIVSVYRCIYLNICIFIYVSIYIMCSYTYLSMSMYLSINIPIHKK